MKSSSKVEYLGPVEAKKIGQEDLLRVSQHGDGLYLFLPRDLTDVYDISSGDRLKVRLITRFRLKEEEEGMIKKEAVETTLVKKTHKRGRN